jgi:hypothetical protein
VHVSVFFHIVSFVAGSAVEPCYPWRVERGEEKEEKVGEGSGARLLCGHIVPHCIEEPSVGGPSFLSWGRMASPLAHGTSRRALTHCLGVTSLIVV